MASKLGTLKAGGSVSMPTTLGKTETCNDRRTPSAMRNALPILHHPTLPFLGDFGENPRHRRVTQPSDEANIGFASSMVWHILLYSHVRLKPQGRLAFGRNAAERSPEMPKP